MFHFSPDSVSDTVFRLRLSLPIPVPRILRIHCEVAVDEWGLDGGRSRDRLQRFLRSRGEIPRGFFRMQAGGGFELMNPNRNISTVVRDPRGVGQLALGGDTFDLPGGAVRLLGRNGGEVT